MMAMTGREWAEAIVVELRKNWDARGGIYKDDPDYVELATALRKAKADGMREAALRCKTHISWMNSDHHGPSDAATEITILMGIIQVAASKLEASTT